jgi:uncharacterized hydrophobic protein (TIGR00271 family)
LSRLGKYTPEPKALRATLFEDSRLNLAFAACSIASAAIATFGLLQNSAAVIIGAMIIARLMMPIQGVTFGVLNVDFRLIRRAVATLLAGAGVSVLIGYVLGIVFSYVELGDVAAAFTSPTLLDLGIAIFAGSIAGFAKLRRDLVASVAGTAIATSLMPPLCVVGLELARGHGSLAGAALLLFVTNVLGITLACMAMYFIGGYANFERARMGLLGTLVLVLLLAIPLAANFLRLVEQTQVERAVRTTLAQTTTFAGVELVSLKIDWSTDPPNVDMVVRSGHVITPRQIGLVETFVDTRTRRHFHFIVDVSQVQVVTSSPSSPPPSPALTP